MSRMKKESKSGLPQPKTNKQTKEVKELLDLAKLTNEESAFQQKHRYKKFKDKYNVDMVVCVYDLMLGLKEIRFFNESIFWCQKILEDIRFCEKQFRCFAFISMTESFYCLGEYEKVIEYGKKCLEHDFLELVVPLDSTAMERKGYVLSCMKLASVKLNMKQEAMKYAREILKVSVALYNANNSEKFQLLDSYCELIDLQIQLGDSKSAKRIFEKHLKLFNLNSTDLNDVLMALKEEGYENILPLAICKRTNKLVIEFAEKFFLSQESLDNWLEKVRIFYHVGKICWLKHIVYFGDTSNLTWGNLSLEVYIDILKHIKLIMENREKFGMIDITEGDQIVRDAISMTLLLADQNHLSRENLFSTLFFSIRSLLTKVKNVSYYVAAAQRENDKINLQKVMPFIQFCLKSLDEGANSNENVDLKLQFVTLKNSLTIMNHFKTNGRKEEY